MNIAIVDDTELEAKIITKFIKEYSAQNKIKSEISYFNRAEDFLKNYSPYKYTVIFMDIYMEGITGIDAARQILQKDSDAKVVFLTSSPDHMADALMMHAFDYLQKPTDKDRFFHLMDDITKKQTSIRKNLYFTFEKKDYSIDVSDIISICSNGHYVDIKLTSGEIYKPYLTFSSIYDELSDGSFLLINRGILVNMDYVSSFESGICNLKDETILPINIKKKKALEQTWENYKFTKRFNH
ncbi:MAG: response regulator transcription factor [Lachnospiraceae bacterium]|nr:response regulator transcription factor [Lachnospiraceae bacterium]